MILIKNEKEYSIAYGIKKKQANNKLLKNACRRERGGK